MWGRILEILRKEMLQMLRDPRMRLILFGPAIVELIIYGYAVTLDVEKSRIGWMDRDNTYESRELLAYFHASTYFQITENPQTADEVRELLDRDKVVAVVHVLPGFGRDVHRNRTAAVQVLVDGTNSNTASIVSSYAGEVIAGYSERLGNAGNNRRAVSAQARAPAAAVPTLSVHSRVWFNPELRSRDYFIPGVVVNILAMITIMLTAMSIVREREIGTMEQLMVSPIRPVELIIGKLLPFAVIGIIDVILVTGAAFVVFDTPFRGNMLFLMGGTILFLMTTLGVGLFISTISRTQQQALMSSFFFLMPALLLSGFAFPIRNMPEPVQLLTYLNPLRYFTEIVRGVFLKGSGFNYLWPSMAVLAVLGIAIITLSAARFKKRIE
ncbi:MAG: ABC transporter permease [Acidobacteriota bacterium]|nr:ABC transporter permease [Acidobacteriota bacterium]